MRKEKPEKTLPCITVYIFINYNKKVSLNHLISI